jgi:hypothetical protein
MRHFPGPVVTVGPAAAGGRVFRSGEIDEDGDDREGQTGGAARLVRQVRQAPGPMPGELPHHAYPMSNRTRGAQPSYSLSSPPLDVTDPI